MYEQTETLKCMFCATYTQRTGIHISNPSVNTWKPGELCIYTCTWPILPNNELFYAQIFIRVFIVSKPHRQSSFAKTVTD